MFFVLLILIFLKLFGKALSKLDNILPQL